MPVIETSFTTVVIVFKTLTTYEYIPVFTLSFDGTTQVPYFVTDPTGSVPMSSLGYSGLLVALPSSAVYLTKVSISDTSIRTLDGPSSTRLGSAPPTSTSSSPSVGAANTHNGPSHREISPRAAAGIAIGVILTLALAVGVFFLIRRHRKRRLEGSRPELEHNTPTANTPLPSVGPEIEKAPRTTAPPMSYGASMLGLLRKAVSGETTPAPPAERAGADSETLGNPTTLASQAHSIAPSATSSTTGVSSDLTDLSPGTETDITRIEELLSRLDLEIAERERLQELRDERARLAARLRDARR